MKKVGYFLITVGFLTGSLVTVLDEVEVQWNLFAVTMLFGIAGVLIVRIATTRMVQETGRLSSTMQQVEESLDRIIDKLAVLSADKESIDPYDMHQLIDEQIPDDINTFVEGRETIGHIYGLQAYADVMSHFAAGERYLNRVWSASADGYIDEVRTYIDIAREQFIDAREQLNRVKLTTENF